MARECGHRGAIPFVCSRDEREVERAITILDRLGVRAKGIAADVRDPDDAQRFIESAIRACGRIDALINNAGVITVGPEASMGREYYQDALATHFWGAYNTIQAVLPHFREMRGGRIVNVSSIGGRISVPHLLPYSVSKFALAGYSEGLRSELAPDGIAVTTVYPGLMRTGSPRNANFTGRASAEYTWFKVFDTLPGISVAAGHAAKCIVDCMARGDATLTISPLAKFASLVHGVAPGLTARVLSLAGAMLPSDEKRSNLPRKGFDVENVITRSPLTALGNVPERELNERSI